MYRYCPRETTGIHFAEKTLATGYNKEDLADEFVTMLETLKAQ